jgi:hypothetical protein
MLSLKKLSLVESPLEPIQRIRPAWGDKSSLISSRVKMEDLDQQQAPQLEMRCLVQTLGKTILE